MLEADIVRMMLIGGAIGLACGIAPMAAGLFKKQVVFAIGSIAACGFAGATLGWLIAAILALALTATILAGGSSFRLSKGEDGEWSRSETFIGVGALSALGFFIIGILIWLLRG